MRIGRKLHLVKASPTMHVLENEIYYRYLGWQPFLAKLWTPSRGLVSIKSLLPAVMGTHGTWTERYAREVIFHLAFHV